METPQLVALVREYGFDAVQAALEDVKQIRLKAIQKSFGTSQFVTRRAAMVTSMRVSRPSAILRCG